MSGFDSSSASEESMTASRKSCALSTTLESGFLISCASPLVIAPISASRSAAIARRSATSACSFLRRRAITNTKVQIAIPRSTPIKKDGLKNTRGTVAPVQAVGAATRAVALAAVAAQPFEPDCALYVTFSPSRKVRKPWSCSITLKCTKIS